MISGKFLFAKKANHVIIAMVCFLVFLCLFFLSNLSNGGKYFLVATNEVRF